MPIGPALTLVLTCMAVTSLRLDFDLRARLKQCGESEVRLLHVKTRTGFDFGLDFHEFHLLSNLCLSLACSTGALLLSRKSPWQTGATH